MLVIDVLLSSLISSSKYIVIIASASTFVDPLDGLINTFGGIVSSTLNVPAANPVATSELFSTESIET